MTLSTVRLTLLIGKTIPTPAPADLMSSIDAVEVNQSDSSGGGSGQGFQITFAAGRGPTATDPYGLTGHHLLNPGNRVIIIVTLNATPQVLMDGIITHQQFSPAGGGQDGSLTVTGEDISVLMDMDEIAISYPGMPHTAIVALILAKYAMYGVVPMVIPPPTEWTKMPLEKVPFQEGTDRAYVRRLAGQHGYIFGIQPGPVPLMNRAYWGPPHRIALPQKALTADLGPGSNVESIQFANDALAPTTADTGLAIPNSVAPLPVIALLSTHLPPFARQPALLFNRPFVRSTRLTEPPSDPIAAYAEAQAIVDRSADAVVTATGTLDALRYQSLLTAPGVVGVRGVGDTYDGLYYVKSVKHHIESGAYKQEFTLTREGTGNLAMRV